MTKVILSKQPSQARSRDKVERILEIAETLLETHPLDDITVALISERSGVGRPTVYQFFPTVRAVLNTLGERFLDELHDDFNNSTAARNAATWEEVSDILVDITVDFYSHHPAACALFIGDGTLHPLRVIDRDFDRRFVDSIRELFSGKVGVEPTEEGDPIQIVVTLGISIIALGVYREGRIGDYYRRQAKLAVRGYLASLT